MATIVDVGNELAEVPFGDLLRSVAEGIADGQRALDMSSLRTLIELTRIQVELIPEVTEVITPEPFTVPVAGQPPVQVTGARVTATASDPVTMSALQAGLEPTFYQFTEATIQLKLSLQVRQTQEVDTEGKKRIGFLAFGSNVNFRTKNTYSYTAEGSSTVTAVLRPVPAPARLTPTTITVNALVQPPTVNVNA